MVIAGNVTEPMYEISTCILYRENRINGTLSVCEYVCV